jgi:nucleotide-binding universal stress UspA family protein
MKSNLTTTQGFKTAVSTSVVETRLSIVVPYTTPELTKAALTHAAILSAGLNATIRLIDVQVVPIQRPLNEPPVNREFSVKRLREIAEEAGIAVQVEIIYTRHRMECFHRTVEAGSLIVIAAGLPLWPTAEKKLARSLSKAGNDVVLVQRAQARGVR